jgi:hypothetical protein
MAAVLKSSSGVVKIPEVEILDTLSTVLFLARERLFKCRTPEAVRYQHAHALGRLEAFKLLFPEVPAVVQAANLAMSELGGFDAWIAQLER